MQASKSAQRNFWLTAGLIALAALTYWPTSRALYEFWADEDTAGAHGFLVVPLAVWLLYRTRQRLASAPVCPSRGALLLLILWSIAWLVFWRAGIQELHILSLPILMGLSVWSALGWQAARSVAFPLFYLYFAVPAWGIFIEPLEHLTALAVGFLAPFIGVPAHRQGDLILFPGGIIEVARGCSGQSFLTVGVAVAALLGELENAAILRRAALAIVMGAAAVVSNWIRVLVIVDAGYTTQMRHVLITRGHFVFGWILFATVLVSCVWVLARRPRETPDERLNRDAWGGGALKPSYVPAAIALAAIPLLVYTCVIRLDNTAAPVSFRAPAGRDGWRGPIVGAANIWEPSFVGKHSQWHSGYQGPAGQNVEMLAIGYPMQEQGRELINEENQLFGPDATQPVAETKVAFAQRAYIELILADKQGHTWLTWSFYDIGGQEFATPLLSQLWYGVRSLGGPPYSVQFAFRTLCDNSCNAARTTLKDFLQAMGPGFLASVGRAGGPSGPTVSSASRPL